MSKIDFDVVIDGTLVGLGLPGATGTRERILTLLNDFEDNRWRASKFCDFVFDHLPESCLSKRERDSLADKSFTALRRGAANLRLTDADSGTEGSELAEILLYGIMKQHYGALPVVPKIFYKQNTRDNAKGADSVHIVVAGDTFTIWFGECKFYNSIEDARLDKVIASVKDALRTEKLKKENSIITSVSDLQECNLSHSLRKKIEDALSPKKSIDTIKPILHVPILLLHECASTAKCVQMSDAYKSEIVKLHHERATSYFARQRKALAEVPHFEKISFHLILFPVPGKDELTKAFLKRVRQLRE